MLIPVWRSMEQIQWRSSSVSVRQHSTHGKSCSQQGHRCMVLFQQFTVICLPSWWGMRLFFCSALLLVQRSVQGSSPPSQSGPTACPGTPCHRSVQQHTVLSDGPPGHGPNTPRLRRTLSGRPVVGAIEQHYRHAHVWHMCVTCICACFLSRDSIILNVAALHMPMDLNAGWQ